MVPFMIPHHLIGMVEVPDVPSGTSAEAVLVDKEERI
jgi:hypothetical protein